MSSSLFNLDACALGGCLTTAQRVGVKNALYKLQLQEKLEELTFWGKVHGSEGDYLIAVATTLDTTITKHFYWRSVTQPSSRTPGLPPLALLRSPSNSSSFLLPLPCTSAHPTLFVHLFPSPCSATTMV